MMSATRTRFLCRSVVVIGLLLALLMITGSATAQDMIRYPDFPVYGLSSGAGATADIYLPLWTGDLLSDPIFRAQDAVQLPAVFFIPALSQQAMDRYAADLTQQGYAVVALHYRQQAAAQDAVCGVSWLHTFAPLFGIDANRIVAFGYGQGGELAALLGSMDPSPQVAGDAGRCPWPVPESPMIEGVATYDGLMDTPLALSDLAHQLTKLPPAGMSRAEMMALMDEFAALPVAEWSGYHIPEAAPVEVAMSEILRERIPPAAPVTVAVPVPEILREQLATPEVTPLFDMTNAQLAAYAQTLPAYWLDGTEPPHMLMVGTESNLVIRADNLAYNNLLREMGVPTTWVEMGGCGHDQCAMLDHLEPLNTFLAEVLVSG